MPESEGEEDGLPEETDHRNTSVLEREAAESAGITRKRVVRGDEDVGASKQKVARKAPGGKNMIFTEILTSHLQCQVVVKPLRRWSTAVRRTQ